MANLVPVAIVTTVDGAEPDSIGLMVDPAEFVSHLEANGARWDGARWIVECPGLRTEYVIDPD